MHAEAAVRQLFERVASQILIGSAAFSLLLFLAIFI